MYRIETKKDVRKLISSIIQFGIMVALLALIISQLFTFITYRPYDPSDTSVVSGEDHGFIAISYFGVDRQSTTSRISEDKLDSHLKALHDLGYVTITQDDIEKYYNEGKALPDKALYLMFEDGRHDTSVYSQKIMERYNYKATMFTYADKFAIRDNYFLMPEDLKKLKDTSFWEIGSNGYRLSYINVFDRYDRYIGELESTEYSMIAGYLGRDYNHYLMDFIRDENDIPMETNSQMKARIAGEYKLMESEYNRGLGEVPGAYILLHSNTGKFGENAKVSAENEKAITSTFKMNFNREGYSLNTSNSSIYDLTRLEPQANWYTNHLLMRIWDDLPEEDKDGITFVEGDAAEKIDWQLYKGAAEYKKETQQIVLTSLPQDTGILELKRNIPANFTFTARLTGNKLGCQSVYLGSGEDEETGIEVRLLNNVLYLIENGEIIEETDLYDFDGIPKISVEEDKRDSLAGEYSALARYAVSNSQSMEYKELVNETLNADVRSVEEGAEEYRPAMQINELGNRLLKVTVNGNKITVFIDGNAVWENAEISPVQDGKLCLKSAWTEYGYSQRNIADDVYDAVFEEVSIIDDDTQGVIYTNKLKGASKGFQAVKDGVNNLINWFIIHI
ncbi:MAG: polysaccharide deacetylase family protein [Lachnospiraceae bacterium]|nr:polysaccharide deacetylase family protein [Lachnospiraceae bacterium]